VESAEDILQILYNMSEVEIESLQERGASARSYFRYRQTDSEETLHSTRTATNTIIQHICRRVSQASYSNEKSS
jgi:hypothetical protein